MLEVVSTAVEAKRMYPGIKVFSLRQIKNRPNHAFKAEQRMFDVVCALVRLVLLFWTCITLAYERAII